MINIEIDVGSLYRSLPHNIFLLDVRDLNEHKDKNIGGICIPVSELDKRINEIPVDKCVYVYCQTGRRSKIAIDFFKTKGIEHCVNIFGGMDAYMSEGYI
jgi:adenylyltransferase/sulfurtransferase